TGIKRTTVPCPLAVAQPIRGTREFVQCQVQLFLRCVLFLFHRTKASGGKRLTDERWKVIGRRVCAESLNENVSGDCFHEVLTSAGDERRIEDAPACSSDVRFQGVSQCAPAEYIQDDR